MASKYLTAAGFAVYDGDVALASDLNSVTSAVEAGFDIVVQDFASIATELSNAVSYATEWANAAEDTLVSALAGGDQVDDYSALHHAAKAAADRGLTNADVVLTHADVVLTHADVVLTHADEALTNADALATAADRVATNADAAQTALDRIATAADVVLTHADVVLTHADEALTNADALATAADRVATNADVVLTHADEALTNADALATAADRAVTNADVVLTHADVVLTNADVVLTHADVALTNADAIATAADRVQTGLDAVSTAADVAAISGGVKLTIDKIVATTANLVDTFIYDTTKDSDGGAWRERCSHLSWYNETLNTATRGATQKFPALALIVATTTSVTIYDLTDDAAPMWMVPVGPLASYVSGVNSVFAVDGTILVGKSSDTVVNLYLFKFISGEVQGFSRTSYSLGLRNLGLLYSNSALALISEIDTSLGLVGSVNDVAITTLPTAPIDPATGLPVPTIAVATDGGISVITDGGDVWDITYSTNTISGHVWFGDDYSLGFTVDSDVNVQYFTHVFDILPTSDVAEGPGYLKGTSDRFYSSSYNAAYTGLDLTLSSAPSNVNCAEATALGLVSGLTHLKENPNAPAEGMVAYTTKDYATGWMHGDIKGAWVPDVDEVSVTGTELVTNGTFDTDITGWDDTSVAGGAIAWNASGHIDLIYTTGAAKVTQDFPVVVGETYAISVETVTPLVNLSILLGSTYNGSEYVSSTIVNTAGVHIFTITATSTLLSIRFSNSTNGTATLDNITCRLAIPDRSVNANGIGVHGTLALNPVATGAELTAFSGFSAANYLQQEYNADLDFGTGDFYVMGWFRHTDSGSTEYLLSKERTVLGAPTLSIYKVTTTGSKAISGVIGGTLFTGVQNTSDDSWHLLSIVREAGECTISIDGVSDVVVSAALTVAGIGNPLVLGCAYDQTLPYHGSMALFRIGAGAPSAEQIAHIYNTEKELFKENAACTLAGTSDSVLALDYDASTDKLHAMTSYGRSGFVGLQRVESEATTVGTPVAVSAVSGNVSQAGSTAVDIYAPAENLRTELARRNDQRLFYGTVPEQFWFDNLVSNGGFDTDTTGWELTGDGTIAAVGGELEVVFGTAATTAHQAVAVVAGETYTISATAREVTTTSGIFRLTGATDAAIQIDSTVDRVISHTFTALSNTLLLYVRLDSIGTLYADNISVRPCDSAGNIIYPLPHGWKPTSVYQERLLQREGVAQDYTEKTDGFLTWIEPAVEPALDDEICVFAIKEG